MKYHGSNYKQTYYLVYQEYLLVQIIDYNFTFIKLQDLHVRGNFLMNMLWSAEHSPEFHQKRNRKLTPDNFTTGKCEVKLNLLKHLSTP